MKHTTTKQEVIEKIINYFEDNNDIFTDCIEELDSYNGYLGDDRIYSMDELPELFSVHDGADMFNLLNRAYFGWDDEAWEVNERGERVHRSSFNPNREYFYFNGYGNLVSTDDKDYSDKLDDWAVEAMAEHSYYIYSIRSNDELKQLFDELEAVEAE